MVKNEISLDFIRLLQAHLKTLNPNVTLEDAWKFYKDFNKDVVKFVNDTPNKRVSLGGVHTLEIIKCKPSKDLEERGYKHDYRLRYRQSTTLSRYLNDLNK